MPTPSPLPGRPVRGSSSGQPFSALLDLLGRRWAITVLWTLRDGPRTFRQIQATDARISSGTLSTRLRELRETRLVEKVDDGYALTVRGEELVAIGHPLADWSRLWAADLTDPM